jgi:zinc protease
MLGGDSDSRIFKRVCAFGRVVLCGRIGAAAGIDRRQQHVRRLRDFAPQNLAKVQAATREEVARGADAGFGEAGGAAVGAAKKALLEERRIARAQDDALAASLVSLGVSRPHVGRCPPRASSGIAAVAVESANAALRKYVDPAGIGYARECGGFREEIIPSPPTPSTGANTPGARRHAHRFSP